MSFIALATLATASTSSGEEEFPLVGTYTENQPCKADGSGRQRCACEDHAERDRFGVSSYTILQNKREGNTFAVHVDCKRRAGAGMLAHVKFTLREDKTVNSSDQDQTYKAVLHKCP